MERGERRKIDYKLEITLCTIFKITLREKVG
jgi:hypothetical protein